MNSTSGNRQLYQSLWYSRTGQLTGIMRQSIHPILTSMYALQGYNATVLAYGQTGAGKTHTMSGGAGIHGIRENGR